MFQQKLKNQWGIWIVYVPDSKNTFQKNYKESTQLLFQFKDFPQLAYIWQKTNISTFSHYFTNIKESKVNKFADNQINNKFRKVDALCFFKYPIEPAWQYGDNSNGGQFCFFFNPDNILEIKTTYESLIFSLLLQDFVIWNEIIGIRIVDRSKAQSTVKVEIWVSFNNERSDLIKAFESDFQKFTNKIKLPISKFQFKNNKQKK